MTTIGEWLAGLEEHREGTAYLWPKTPVANIQAEIWRRTGASDLNMSNPNCRATNIVHTLHELTANYLLPRPFTVLDLCCGDGLVLAQIGRTFLQAQCYGADLQRYPEHRIGETRGGCAFYRAPLQGVVGSKPPAVIDVCLMLNTFRGWDKANLPPEDYDLPQRTLYWLRGFCRFVVLTVTKAQQAWLKREGFFIWTVGKGEDDSDLICGFPCDNGSGLWSLE